MRSAVAIALALAVASCSGSPPPKPHATPNPTAKVVEADAGHDAAPSRDALLATKESKRVARTLAKIGPIRGLSSTRPVPGVRLSRDELVARVKEKALREYPPEALRREGQILQILGFAPTSFDYLGEILKLLEAQLEGFYDPKSGTMYLAADLHGEEARVTLAHELVHALQDQHWDLKQRSTYKPGESDKSMALAALAEGDATSAMMDFALASQGRTALDLPPDLLRQLMKSGIDMGSIKSVPHILRTTLIAPYIDGLAFVHARRKKAGWRGVDAAWERMPTTTEQILHPDKWASNEGAVTIPAPTAQALGAGWKREDEDTFGELGFALAFEEWMDAKDARAAASGWGGDRTATYANGDAVAYSVHLRYDEGAPKADAIAKGAWTKLAPALKKKLGKPAVSRGSALCFERAELGPLWVSLEGRDLVLLAGPAHVKGKTWSSAGTCATSKEWAAEVAAQGPKASK